MKIKFKHQDFQVKAVQSVVNVFKGQPNEASMFTLDRGRRTKVEYADDLTQDGAGQQDASADPGIGFKNYPIQLPDQSILENVQQIQRDNLLEPSDQLAGRYNLTVEMETGTGKTYTYIRTMFELYAKYGWSK